MTIQTSDKGCDHSGWSSWYVLTTSNPTHFEELVAAENVVSDGQYECYCPYTALPEDSAKKDTSGQISLRSALRRYVFVRVLKTVEEQIFVSTVVDWNKNLSDSIHFLMSGQGKRARVSQYQLNLMKSCCDELLFKPDDRPAASDLRVGQKIRLSDTPFADSDKECVIQSISYKRNGVIELRVEMTLFNVRFSNLVVTYEDNTATASLSDKVYDAQQKLLAIFRRKVNAKETEASKIQDELTLRRIFKGHDVTFPNGAMKRHHLALILICARLMSDAEAVWQYTKIVKVELSELSKLRESKAATDSRAWLHIALFIATGKPQYRDMAKAYIRQYNPKSTYLQQFVKQSCKTAGEKWIGLKKRRKTIV